MEIEPKTWRVRNPLMTTWANRFASEDGAWGRVMGLKGVRDTPGNRAAMVESGWSVWDANATDHFR